ncbi:MAG TPA: hypothetical protein PLV92_29305, partial [Pirellulaceae bacterium]|nr:hypothetical protein [Pirellulaceae bacterium]
LRSGLALAVDQHTAVDQRRPLEEIAQTLADFRKVDAALPSVPAGAPVDRQVDARERELFKTAFELLRAEVRGGLSSLLAQPRRGLDIALKLQAANPEDADVAMSVADFQALAGNWPAARESLAAAVERTPDGAERDARRKRLTAIDSLAQLAKPEGVELAKLLESVNTAAAARTQLSPALDLALARSLVDLVVAQPATRDVVYPVLTPALNKLLKDESTAAASGELNQRYLELRRVEREEIRKRIAAEIDRPTAPDFATVLTYCQDVERKGLADSLVRALKTECMLQTLRDGSKDSSKEVSKDSSKDVSKERLSECEREVNLFLGAPDVEVVYQPYVQYVAAMVRAAGRGESLD